MSAFQADRIKREQAFREKAATITNGDKYKKAVDKYITDFTRTIGGYLSVSYGFEKVKFSHELQIAAFDVQWYLKNGKGKPMILFIPLIIRFRL